MTLDSNLDVGSVLLVERFDAFRSSFLSRKRGSAATRPPY